MLTLTGRIFLFIAVFTFKPIFSSAQVQGCTDPLSTNYNPLAETNDGSCVYATQSIVPLSSVLLSDTVRETSGLMLWNDGIWTHNDNADTDLYRIDPNNGTVAGRIVLPTVGNTDWEEISQDADYIYLGDFGNNSVGNRTDLHILRVPKSVLPGTNAIDTIAFSYSNQVDFTVTPGNATNFDCEAFVVTQDSIYLFSKRWIDKKTFLYAMPKTPGNHTAMLRDSLNVQGLITGATYLENKNLLVLCGYTSALQPFVYACYDFQGSKFFSGNKRKFGVSLSYTQVEGIATNDGLRYFISNEKFVNGPISSPQKLHVLDLGNYLQPFLTATLQENDPQAKFDIYPNPVADEINLSESHLLMGKTYSIVDLSGKTLDSGTISTSKLNIQNLQSGIYLLKIAGMRPQQFVRQ